MSCRYSSLDTPSAAVKLKVFKGIILRISSAYNVCVLSQAAFRTCLQNSSIEFAFAGREAQEFWIREDRKLKSRIDQSLDQIANFELSGWSHEAGHYYQDSKRIFAPDLAAQ